MKTHPNRGSHLPLLMKAVGLTVGPIVELGSGMYSSSYLHWVCFPKRRLVTYESNPQYFDYIRQFTTDYHEIRCIDDWDNVSLDETWSVALVDHAPDNRRIEEIKKLVHVPYVVIHDTENRFEKKYRYSTIHHLFRYRYKFRAVYPHASIFSNFFDVTNFLGENI